MGLKESFKSITQNMEKSSLFINFPFSPNILTLFSIFLAVIGAYYIYLNVIYMAILFIALSLLMDGLDGIVARAQKKQTKFGAFLDGVSDRVVEFIILFSLIFYTWPNQLFMQIMLLLILFFGSIMTSYIVAYSVHREVVKNKDTNKMKIVFARAERTILILIILISLIFYSEIVSYLVTIGAVLSIFSFMQRVIFVYKYDKGLI